MFAYFDSGEIEIIPPFKCVRVVITRSQRDPSTAGKETAEYLDWMGSSLRNVPTPAYPTCWSCGRRMFQFLDYDMNDSHCSLLHRRVAADCSSTLIV